MDLEDAEAFSFDCYGTLIDWEAGLVAVLGPWARRQGLEVDDEHLLAAYARHEEAAERDHPGDLYPVILARSLRALGNELAGVVPDADAERLARSVPDWPAFPDSHDALAALGRRAALLVLSNVDRASFGSYKPSPRTFRALLDEARRLGVREGGLVHVAQSLFHDHVPAQAAGLPTVWISRRHDRAGWGATPAPSVPVRPDWEFPS